MKYSRIVSYVQSQLWAIESEKLSEILSVLAFRSAGGEFTPDEIKARLGDSMAERADEAQQSGAVGILPIRGTIAHRMGAMEASSGGASCEAIAANFRQLLANPQVSTIVLDVDSPGGTVTGIAELAAEIFAARGQKKIVAVTNGMNASAAYWVASQADEIVSIPSGQTGSIGVFTVNADLSKKLEQEGVDVTIFRAGKYKFEVNPFEALSEEAKARIQANVDEAYSSFVRDVARGRGVSPADVRSGFGQGRVLTAKESKAAGLIDRIDTMDGVLGRLLGKSSRAGLRAEDDPPPVLAIEPVDEEIPPVPVAPAAVDALDVERRYRLL